MIEQYNYNEELSGRADTLAMALDKCERLEKENAQLKELLKRARGLMNYTKDLACSDATEEMITKINQALGEE